MRRNSVLPVVLMALLSLAMTLILTLLWEFVLEGPVLSEFGIPVFLVSENVHWAHIYTTMGFATVAVTIVAALAFGLVHAVQDREQSLDKAQAQRRSFAADAAHELRTPLAVLRAHIDSLDENDTTLALREDVERITRIVEQVLVKSRLEVLEIKPGDRMDLARLCRDTSAYLAPLVIKEGRSIEVVGAEHECIIRGDAFALEHALRNLIENAIKYSARGSIITVKLTDESAVQVIDHGQGVDPAMREAIFERFQRADRRADGAGLGLAIVRTVIDAHGGRVEVDDAPGGGAVFTLYFPTK